MLSDGLVLSVLGFMPRAGEGMLWALSEPGDLVAPGYPGSEGKEGRQQSLLC